jgi:phenylacetate-CoA ligase
VAEPDKFRVARSFYDSLMRSQWLPEARIKAYQETQLQQMLAHAWAQVPFYAEPLGRIRNPDGSFDLKRWHELPIIDKSVIQQDPQAFKARELPLGHQGLINTSTSGSEGDSLTIVKTRFEHTGAAAASFRYSNWFGYDYAVPLAMIRAGFITLPNPEDPEDQKWGPPWLDPATRGARYRLHINTPLEEQLDWLMTLGPVYLNTLPSTAMALAQHSEKTGKVPSIRGVMTVGERLSQDVRNEVRRIWGCRMSDVYATAETGLVAIECPDAGGYHLQTEMSRAKVVSEDGKVCGSGDTGYLVCTSIYNFAMPMIRYRFKDLVTLGPPCSCGRGLPKLAAIEGRSSNLLIDADGKYFTPEISTAKIIALCGARQWQLVQHAINACTLRLQLETLPSQDILRKLAIYFDSLLPKGTVLSFEAVASMPRSSGGKFYPIVRQN